jgi:predicted outer membrane protein
MASTLWSTARHATRTPVSRAALGAGAACAAVLLLLGLLLLGLLLLGTAAASGAQARRDAGEVPPSLAELVRQVHQASLVEIWVGQRAQQLSDNPAVRWVGQSMVAEHEELDEEVEKVAGTFDIALPSEPTRWQRAGARRMAR